MKDHHQNQKQALKLNIVSFEIKYFIAYKSNKFYVVRTGRNLLEKKDTERRTL